MPFAFRARHPALAFCDDVEGSVTPPDGLPTVIQGPNVEQERIADTSLGKLGWRGVTVSTDKEASGNAQEDDCILCDAHAGGLLTVMPGRAGS